MYATKERITRPMPPQDNAVTARQTIRFTDKRPEAVAQAKFQQAAKSGFPGLTGLPAQLKTEMTGISPVIQMKKYVMKPSGTVVVAKDSYTLKEGEIALTKDEYKEHLFKQHGPGKGKKVGAPGVREEAPKGRKVAKKKGADLGGDLIYRGMSVNNLANLYGDSPAIFTVQNPEGTATPEEHIVDDSLDSPYLSFEAGGLAVSAGKYAPKPVDDDNKPLGVEILEGGFLKQDKSYTKESQGEHEGKKRIGVVAGIRKRREHLDFATQEKAEKLKGKKAQDLAIADKEVLVKPGAEGIKREDVPFFAKVKRVPETYYKKNIKNQSSKKALGFFDGTYYKTQIDQARSDTFSFDVDDELLRRADESDDEMSDIEDLNLDRQ